MTTRFDPAARLIHLTGYLTGPAGTVDVRFVLDTGASGTVVRATSPAAAGIVTPPGAPRRRMHGLAAGATAPVARVRHLLAVGHGRADFPAAAFDFAPTRPYDGLLGLDFFRGLVLKLDFAGGVITLRPPRPRWPFWR
ncbi:MAG: retroviral-like aspartic protease family protein [Gemmataceae bacterium]|nr:retroviral-like aspartic protease family protein [Gemmataceae bacterium]